MKKTLITLLATLFFIPLSGIGYGNYGNNCWCNDGTQIYVDLLYLRPDGAELNYLFTRGEVTNDGVTTIIDQNFSVDPNWRPGVRVGMETGFGCPDLNIFANWTWYETKAGNSLDLAPIVGGTLEVQSDFLSDSTLITIGRVDTDFYFMFNWVDVGISKPCCLCENVKFKPFGAFTYLHVDQ
ncbi:MAG: hypothetical protein WD595_03985, partial [Waddliaceae bacterium]